MSPEETERLIREVQRRRFSDEDAKGRILEVLDRHMELINRHPEIALQAGEMDGELRELIDYLESCPLEQMA